MSQVYAKLVLLHPTKITYPINMTNILQLIVIILTLFAKTQCCQQQQQLSFCYYMQHPLV
jgi:hypothetical protein